MDKNGSENTTSGSCGVTRKSILVTCLIVGILAIIATAVAVPLSKKNDDDAAMTDLEKAKQILSESPLIDG